MISYSNIIRATIAEVAQPLIPTLLLTVEPPDFVVDLDLVSVSELVVFDTAALTTLEQSVKVVSSATPMRLIFFILHNEH